MKKLRKEVRWFADRMEAKLRANDHKGGWAKGYAEYFLCKMNEEFKELLEALESGNYEAGISECVDLANYAMMLADNLHRDGVVSDGWLAWQAGGKVNSR